MVRNRHSAKMFRPPSKPEKRRFTPELMRPVSNEYETEMESGASQASRTPRKRTIAKWEVVMELSKYDHSQEEAWDILIYGRG